MLDKQSAALPGVGISHATNKAISVPAEKVLGLDCYLIIILSAPFDFDYRIGENPA